MDEDRLNVLVRLVALVGLAAVGHQMPAKAHRDSRVGLRVPVDSAVTMFVATGAEQRTMRPDLDHSVARQDGDRSADDQPPS
jgi:hypothetical protein